MSTQETSTTTNEDLTYVHKRHRILCFSGFTTVESPPIVRLSWDKLHQPSEKTTREESTCEC